MQAGWSHWTIPQAGDYVWGYDAATGIVTTPTTTQANPWERECNEHVTTVRSYPDGFILELEYRFDPEQLPIFPLNRVAENKHRPTFLGNSGVGIYGWDGNARSKYLYEVQVTDNSGMTGGARNFASVAKNRFVRLDYGSDWTQRGTWALLGSNQAQEGILLADEKTFFNPTLSPGFTAAINTGGADCICAIVAGYPVSYFQDVFLTDPIKGNFPKPETAVSSAIPLGANESPLRLIGGTEEPLNMYWGHRADNLAPMMEPYVHHNHLDRSAWNSLRICFLPARYKANGDKCLNAYLHTSVNPIESYAGGFQGELKSGTRSSRHTGGDRAQDPEPDVYLHGHGDLKIRLLGHWGSKVKYRNITIRSVGSVE